MGNFKGFISIVDFHMNKKNLNCLNKLETERTQTISSYEGIKDSIIQLYWKPPQNSEVAQSRVLLELFGFSKSFIKF